MSASDGRGALSVDLLEAAIRTEGKGQLNIGKLLRACAVSVTQSAAGEGGFPDDREQLAQDLLALSQRLKVSGVPARDQRSRRSGEPTGGPGRAELPRPFSGPVRLPAVRLYYRHGAAAEL